MTLELTFKGLSKVFLKDQGSSQDDVTSLKIPTMRLSALCKLQVLSPHCDSCLRHCLRKIRRSPLVTFIKMPMEFAVSSFLRTTSTFQIFLSR